MNTKHNYTETELLQFWLAIGNKNFWISGAYDPPFTIASLTKTNSIEELKTLIQKGNWCLGQGFYYQNLCFIDQVDGGDEWLTIRADLDFNSFTFYYIIKSGQFETIINRLLNASNEDLKSGRILNLPVTLAMKN